MDFEKPPQENNKINKLRQFGFRSENDFRQAVEEALETSEKTGGYEIGTGGFLRMVAGNQKLSPKEFGQLNHLIREEIKNVRKKNEGSQPSSGETTLKEAEDLRMIQESAELEEKERQRLHGKDSDEGLYN